MQNHCTSVTNELKSKICRKKVQKNYTFEKQISTFIKFFTVNHTKEYYMKAIHFIRTFLLLVVVATISVRCSCEDPKPAATPQQNLSRVWKIQSAKLNGADFPAGTDFSAFRVTFTTSGGYSIVRGASPVSPSKAPSGSGTWSLNTTATVVTIDAGTSNSRTLDLSNLSATTATIVWTEDTDKNNPKITFNLVPAQ